MRLLAALFVVAGFALAPLAFDDRVATWSDVVPREGLSTSAATRPGRSHLAVDAAGQTTWNGRCDAGDWLRIDLGRTVPVTGVVVDLGQLQENYPRELEVAAVPPDIVRGRRGLDLDRRRYRTWLEYSAEEPIPASAVVVRMTLNSADHSASGRWDVRDVRIRSAEERRLDVAAWGRALRESAVPFVLALAVVLLAAGRPRSAEEGRRGA